MSKQLTDGAQAALDKYGSAHLEKAQAVADKVTKKAMDALDGLEREMIIMKWPAEFRAIMWGAVATIASTRADEARGTVL